MPIISKEFLVGVIQEAFESPSATDYLQFKSMIDLGIESSNNINRTGMRQQYNLGTTIREDFLKDLKNQLYNPFINFYSSNKSISTTSLLSFISGINKDLKGIQLNSPDTKDNWIPHTFPGIDSIKIPSSEISLPENKLFDTVSSYSNHCLENYSYYFFGRTNPIQYYLSDEINNLISRIGNIFNKNKDFSFKKMFPSEQSTDYDAESLFKVSNFLLKWIFLDSGKESVQKLISFEIQLHLILLNILEMLVTFDSKDLYSLQNLSCFYSYIYGLIYQDYDQETEYLKGEKEYKFFMAEKNIIFKIFISFLDNNQKNFDTYVSDFIRLYNDIINQNPIFHNQNQFDDFINLYIMGNGYSLFLPTTSIIFKITSTDSPNKEKINNVEVLINGKKLNNSHFIDNFFSSSVKLYLNSPYVNQCEISQIQNISMYKWIVNINPVWFWIWGISFFINFVLFILFCVYYRKFVNIKKQKINFNMYLTNERLVN